MLYSEAGLYDRIVVQEIISEFAKSKQMCHNNFAQKIIIIHEAEKLSRPAQQALRRTMEKFSANVRLIFISTCESRFIGAIRSRCLGVRVPLLDDEQVSNRRLPDDDDNV